MVREEQWILNEDCTKIIDERIDKSGIHFFGQSILHKTVSGTLFFDSHYDKTLQRRILDASYFQNPYGESQIDPYLFPARKRFVIQDKNSTYYRMGWE